MESGAKQAQPNSCRTSWPQEKPNRHVTRVDNVVIGLPFVDAVEVRDTNFTTWSDEPVLPDREDCRAIMMVERVEQFDVFLSCCGLRELSVCTTSATDLQQSLSMSTHQFEPLITSITYLPSLALSLLRSQLNLEKLDL